MSGRSKLLTWGLPLIGCGSLIAGTGLVIGNRPVTPAESPPRTPTSAPLQVADTAQFIGAIGTSEPPGEPIAIAASVGGVVTAVTVEVGGRVAEDDVLFVVDDRQARAEVAVARSRLAVSEAELARQRAQVGPARADVAAAEAGLETARSNVATAEVELADRRNQLRIAEAVEDPRAIAAEEVDRRRFAVEQADARLAAARAAVTEAAARSTRATAELALLIDPETGEDGPDLLAAEQRVAEAASGLQSAEVTLDLHTVRAPLDARVLQVNVRPGEFAPASVPATGLVVLGRPGPDHLRVEIDEVDIPRFDPRADAWASPRGAANRRLPLEFAYLEPLVVPKNTLSGRTRELVDTRVLQVVYRLPEDDDLVGVGQLFDVFVAAPEAR